MLTSGRTFVPEINDMIANWMHFTLGAVMLVVAFGTLFAPHVVDARGAFTDDPDSVFYQAAQDIGFRYETEFSGVDDKTLRKLLRSASRLVTLEDQPPPTLAALERRVRGDLDRMQKVLRSEGFYAAGVEYRMEPDRKPVRVTLQIVTAARYVLKQFVIVYSGPGSGDPDLPRDADRIGASAGQAARAELVADARRRLLVMLENAGRPLARVVDQLAVVDHADDSLSVTMEITPGEQARFGPLAIAGATSVETDYIAGFIPWRQGEVFDRSKLNDARQRLLDTGLFSVVAFERPNALDANGELPVTVRVEERKHRSISLGGRWSTDEGFAVDARWEHRNLFGRQELLSVSGEVGEIRREFAAAFKKPHFLRRDQDLLASGALAREDTDAFDGPLTRYFVGLQRKITGNSPWTQMANCPLPFAWRNENTGPSASAGDGLPTKGSPSMRGGSIATCSVVRSCCPFRGKLAKSGANSRRHSRNRIFCAGTRICWPAARLPGRIPTRSTGL